MNITLLKSKIHRATVTDSHLAYEGSITIDQSLREQAGLFLGEKVLVVNVTNGARVETYVIEGEAGSGTMCMNGAAAHYYDKGDIIIVMSFAHMSLDEAATHKPTMVKVDSENKAI